MAVEIAVVPTKMMKTTTVVLAVVIQVKNTLSGLENLVLMTPRAQEIITL